MRAFPDSFPSQVSSRASAVGIVPTSQKRQTIQNALNIRKRPDTMPVSTYSSNGETAMNKELLPSLKKGLQRIAANEDPIFKYAMSLKERDVSLSDDEAYRLAEEILSREATPRVRTEADDEEAKAWKSLTMATVAKVFGILPNAV